MARFILVEWNEENGRRSFSTPRGAREIVSAENLDELLPSIAAMSGTDVQTVLADGGGESDGAD